MATMHLAIRDDLLAWAGSQVREGRYGSTDELVNDLLARERDQERKREWLRQAIADGLASGEPVPGEQAFEEVRARYGLSGA